MAQVFNNENRLNDPHIHIEHAKLHAINDTYLLAHMTHLQALC